MCPVFVLCNAKFDNFCKKLLFVKNNSHSVPMPCLDLTPTTFENRIHDVQRTFTMKRLNIQSHKNLRCDFHFSNHIKNLALILRELQFLMGNPRIMCNTRDGNCSTRSESTFTGWLALQELFPCNKLLSKFSCQKKPAH